VPEQLDQQIRQVIAEGARLSVDVASLGDDDDLFEVGMSSHGSVKLMLALEEVFDVEFPDAMLKRSVFASIAAIRAAVTTLLTESV
jgi:acyl carrier protein